MTEKTVIEEREETHGPFSTTSKIAQNIKFSMLYGDSKWVSLKPDQREALDMIAHKIARIVSGNPNEVDHWTDIAGYASLVTRQLEKTRDDN